jgi:hypothetical protein
MLFERFLKKKQQDLPIEEDQAVLAARARSHADPAVRREATRRLLGLAELRLVLTNDSDAGVREIAAARYRHLLCGIPSTEVPLDARLAELAEVQDQHILDQVATQADAPELRRAAIARLGSQTQLAICAVQDPHAGNRAAAIERVFDKAALEQILRQIGKKDKNVYRGAREKLRLIAEREERPRRVRALCDELCEKAERLGRLEHWGQDRALLDHLDQQWAEIRDEAEPAWQARFESARARFLQAYADQARETAARVAAAEAHDALYARRLALLDALGEAAQLNSESEIRALCERITTDWEALERLAAPRQQPLDERFRAALAAAQSARLALGDQRKRLERVAKVGAKAQALVEESKPLDLRLVETFIRDGRELLAGLAATAETTACAELLERLESRAATQHKHAERRLEQLPEKLAELEQHLTDGELKKADPLYQSLNAALDLIAASGLRKGTAERIAARLHALATRLRDLQHWRRWGADQHREGLCDEMERLVTAELPLEALSERLHSLRTDWKGLDRAGPRASQELRDRFHQAAEAVHERCRPFLEARRAEHEANRAARESVCAQIEDFLAKVDWERVDWKRVLRAERETRHAWAAIGPVDPRHHRLLEGRFRQALRQLDRRLDGERKRNQVLKQTLIGKVQSLIDEPDLDTAIERAKALQREWQTTVPGRHKDENRLWLDFRAACDAVFERRAALHQAHASELQETLALRESICDEALALAAGETDPERLARAFKALEQRWEDALSLPIPRQSGPRLKERWREAQETVRAQLRAGEDRKRHESLDLLARQADLCEQLELGLLGEREPALTPEQAEAIWTRLPTQADMSLQQDIGARFALAIAAARDPQQVQSLRQRYEANAGRLNQICLQLEILAGVETPREHAKERLEFQVARLTERMVDGEDDPLQGSARLLREWYLCGPAPRLGGVDARFERIRAALVAGAQSGETTLEDVT